MQNIWICGKVLHQSAVTFFAASFARVLSPAVQPEINLQFYNYICVFFQKSLDNRLSICYNIVCYRGVAQLVAHASGGRDAAGSSPVTPTSKNGLLRQVVFSTKYALRRVK